ncbi:MAG: TolC family protein, partial [Gemmatimonadota bacterium]|nr:TolC family protein [Gemmatimonadota bacterium]
LETGVMRSSDPVAAFGTRLRQRRFTESDFAVARLNDPDPIDDWTAGLRVAWQGLDPAAWASAAASGREADAARHAEARAHRAIVFETTRVYFEAAAAEARMRSAEAAVEAARATHDRFARRRGQGLLTEADLLQARAELASAEAALLGARQERSEAHRRLGLAMGWAPDSIPVPTAGLGTEALSEPSAGRGDVSEAGWTPEARADVRTLASLASAAEARARAASSSWFPRLEAFGGYTTHAADPFTSDGPEWTVGLILSWDLFTGFRRPATVARARASARAARAELDRAERAAVVEIRDARGGLEAARGAAEASRAAVEAAAAGRDLMRRRFEEGLASPADLLQAEARAVDMERRWIDARAGLRVARARLELALGGARESVSQSETRGGGQ